MALELGNLVRVLYRRLFTLAHLNKYLRLDCIRLRNHIVNDWKMILRHLGVEEAVLDYVDTNHLGAIEKSYQGLLEWTRSAGTQGATIRNLCHALSTVNCTGAIEKLSSRGMIWASIF